MSFFAIFLSLDHQFSFKLHTMIACNNVWRLVEIKPRIRFFAIFSSLVHQFSFKLHRRISCNNTQLIVELKSTKKTLGTQIWAKRAKIVPKIRFFTIFSSSVHQFSWKLHKMIDWNNVYIPVDVKLAKKFWSPNWTKCAKIRPKFRFFVIF